MHDQPRNARLAAVALLGAAALASGAGCEPAASGADEPLETASQQLQQAPPDGGCFCPLVHSPVCGSDGRTYGNACAAACAKVEVVHPGLCRSRPPCRRDDSPPSSRPVVECDPCLRETSGTVAPLCGPGERCRVEPVVCVREPCPPSAWCEAIPSTPPSPAIASRPGGPVAAPPPPVCDPGDTQFCTTAAGCTGQRTCTRIGQWGSCMGPASCNHAPSVRLVTRAPAPPLVWPTMTYVRPRVAVSLEATDTGPIASAALVITKRTFCQERRGRSDVVNPVVETSQSTWQVPATVTGAQASGSAELDAGNDECPPGASPVRTTFEVRGEATDVAGASARTSLYRFVRLASISVMTYNIQGGMAGIPVLEEVGKETTTGGVAFDEGDYDLAAVARAIDAEQVDVALLQQVHRGFGAGSNFDDQVALLAAQTGMQASFSYGVTRMRPGWCYALAPASLAFPICRAPEPFQAGLVVLSRFPIVGEDRVELSVSAPRPADDVGGSVNGFQVDTISYQVVHVDVGEQPLRLFNVHAGEEATRPINSAILERLGASNVPAILGGDFNGGEPEADMALLRSKFQETCDALSTQTEDLLDGPADGCTPATSFTYIDHLYVSTQSQPLLRVLDSYMPQPAAVCDPAVKGLCRQPSDHVPVVARLRLF